MARVYLRALKTATCRRKTTMTLSIFKRQKVNSLGETLFVTHHTLAPQIFFHCLIAIVTLNTRWRQEDAE